MASNGNLPASSLRPVAGGGNLDPPAAAAWNALAAHIWQARGVKIAPNGPDSTYRSLTRQQYWRDYWCSRGLCGNAAVPGTSNHGLGLAVDTDDSALVNAYGAPFGWQKAWSDACVPLSTRILTRAGLVNYEDVVPGDETVGYDLTTGETAWTPIYGINRSHQEVLRHEHQSLRLDATAGHKWLRTPREGGSATLRAMDEGPDSQDRVLLAGAGAEGAGLPISDDEAALLGWALTDGSIYRFDNSRGRRAFARVYQKKAIGVAEVDRTLATIPHRRDAGYNDGGCVMWYVGRGEFSPILHRSRLDDLGIVGMVLAMSESQRRAWLDAVRLAEGDLDKGVRYVAQSEKARTAGGHTAIARREAIGIAGALEGFLVTFGPVYVTLRKHPALRRNYLTTTSLGEQEVWCPTTGLGTWMAEQNGQLFLTGNSAEPWHFRYAPGHFNGPDPGPDYRGKPPKWYRRLGNRIEQARKRRLSKKQRRKHGDPTATRRARLHRQIQRLGDQIKRWVNRRRKWSGK